MSPVERVRIRCSVACNPPAIICEEVTMRMFRVSLQGVVACNLFLGNKRYEYVILDFRMALKIFLGVVEVDEHVIHLVGLACGIELSMMFFSSVSFSPTSS